MVVERNPFRISEILKVIPLSFMVLLCVKWCESASYAPLYRARHFGLEGWVDPAGASPHKGEDLGGGKVDEKRVKSCWVHKKGCLFKQPFLWPQQDLNLRPTDYESAALTAELWGQVLRTSLRL